MVDRLNSRYMLAALLHVRDKGCPQQLDCQEVGHKAAVLTMADNLGLDESMVDSYLVKLL